MVFDCENGDAFRRQHGPCHGSDETRRARSNGIGVRGAARDRHAYGGTPAFRMRSTGPERARAVGDRPA
jgi:hypothetical protein